ncbi:hypothetical protein GCM10027431_28170 [Lysobacter rhizosphaerae]
MKCSPLARLALSCLLPVLALAACHRFNGDATEPQNTDELHVDLKPHPMLAYKITATIDDAPGPFAMVEGMGSYQVVNSDACGKRDKWAGLTTGLNTGVPFELIKVSDTRYEGTFYLDRLPDADYYGNGVCRWEFVAVSVSFSATGKDKNETTFEPDLSAKEVSAGGQKKTYFPKEFYLLPSGIENYSTIGQPDRSQFAPGITDDELFTITLTAEQVQP